MSETLHIGRKIRNRRDELGWTLEYLAEKSELSSRSLDDIELGKTVDPHFSTIVKIANALAMDLETLNIHKPEVL